MIGVELSNLWFQPARQWSLCLDARRDILRMPQIYTMNAPRRKYICATGLPIVPHCVVKAAWSIGLVPSVERC